MNIAVRLLWSAGDREYRRSTSSLHRLRAETLQFRQNPSFSSFSSFLVTLRRIYSCCYTLNKLDASTNGNYAIYRNPRDATASGPRVSKSRSSLGLGV